MKNLLDQWLGDSVSVLEYLEHEVGESHYAIQRALAEIRRHEDDIERLEQKIAVIRRATSELEGAVEETQFEREFDDAFFAPENLVEHARGDERSAEPELPYMDEDEDSNVVHVMPKVAAGAARLPPPPPAAARLRR